MNITDKTFFTLLYKQRLKIKLEVSLRQNTCKVLNNVMFKHFNILEFEDIESVRHLVVLHPECT